MQGGDWLVARAREGNPTNNVYTFDEVYPGERADLVRELRTALSGCEEPETDRLGRVMLAAIVLNVLPVLRATVAVWRDAYLHMLTDGDEGPATAGALDANEQARLRALKERLQRGDGG